LTPRWLDRHGKIVGQQIPNRVTPRSSGLIVSCLWITP
jgi:hypothetical protein